MSLATHMRLGLVLCFYALLSAPLAAKPAPRRAPAKPPLTTLMYMVNRPEAIASFRAHAGGISIVAPQCFTMDAEGFIGGEVPAEVLEIARTQRVAVMPLVTNRRFDQPLMHTVLDSADSRARAIRYLLYYALRDGYLGFQFDYENIHHTYHEKFTQFFREAAREFHRHHLLLSAAVVGKYSDDRNAASPGGFDNWSGVYDYAALGKVADFLSIMAYPQHAGFSGPGPIAGYTWVQKIAGYTTERLPAQKVSLGVPLYGVQWTALKPGDAPAQPGFVQDAAPANQKWKTRSVRFGADIMPRLVAGAALWDEDERAPHFTFADQGAAVELWYEDARSLAAKLELAAQSGFAGVSGWSLGSEDPAFWAELERYAVRHPRAPLRTEPFEQRAKRAARALGSSSPAKHGDAPRSGN